MTIAIYLAGIVLGCCALWLVLASASPGPDRLGPSWRQVWLPILASTAAAATFIIIRFVDAEAPVSPNVVIRGWLGFFLIFAIVFAVSTASLIALTNRIRWWAAPRT